MDYHKFNQVVTPITAAVPDVLSSMKQINTISELYYTTSRWQILLSLYQREVSSEDICPNQRVTSSIPSLGHMPGLQARSPVGGQAHERQPDIDVSLSLPLAKNKVNE